MRPAPLPHEVCDYSGLPYCCCQDLHGVVGRNPREVRPRGDLDLRKEVKRRFPELRRQAAARGVELNERLPRVGDIRLLGSSLKVEKGAGKGVVTAILYLSPSFESGRNLCPYATPECSAFCLGHSAGQLSMSDARNARAWKTILYLFDRPLFMALLASEIRDFQKKVKKKYRGRNRKIAAVRLDGSSDLGLARVLAPRFPDVQFYDYTKNYPRVLQYLRGAFPPNWHLTFSYSGRNLQEALTVLRYGGNVAVVFDADPRFCDPIPEYWHRFRVIDADQDDLRFWDPPGHVAGLRFKKAHGRKAAMEAAGPFVERPSKRRKLLPRIDKNPLLAIVGEGFAANPPVQQVHPLAFEARERYRADMAAGHDDAAEYWRGQAGAFFTGNPRGGDWRELERAEAELGALDQVAGEDPVGRVKSRSKKRGKVKKNRTLKGKGKPKFKTVRVTIEDARKRFEGVDAAVKAFKKFHKREPSHVDVYVYDDGKPDVTVGRVHAALHRTIDTNYFVPWKSNKKNTLWKHEHVEGYDLRSNKATPKADLFPLEVLDPATGTTRKIAGRFLVSTWWYD